MNPFLLTFDLIIFILIVVISKKSTSLSIVVLLLGIVGTLYIINPHGNYWVENIAVHPKNLHDEIIQNLDQCHKYIPLGICRILYNKSIVFSQHLILLFLVQFSQENIFSFLPSLIKPLATLWVYVGLLNLYKTKPSPLIQTMRLWSILYGMLGFWGYRMDLSFAAIGFLLFTTTQGFVTSIRLIQNIKNHAFS